MDKLSHVWKVSRRVFLNKKALVDFTVDIALVILLTIFILGICALSILDLAKFGIAIVTIILVLVLLSLAAFTYKRLKTIFMVWILGLLKR